ncbi:MAG: TPM domain-containing protein [Fermentimonas sp.]|nr:TPM domain-containing protein [Fermentimonas sp.]
MLKREELDKISESIRFAESNTSGEIRVYIAKHCKGAPLETAYKVFHQLKMDETDLRNGVLIYLSPSDHKAAIYADKGINYQIDESDFWKDTLELMLSYFKKDLIAEGICKGVGKVGEVIKSRFPVSENDINELDNEVIIEE